MIIQKKCLKSKIPAKIPPVIAIVFIVEKPGKPEIIPVVIAAIVRKRPRLRIEKINLIMAGHERISGEEMAEELYLFLKLRTVKPLVNPFFPYNDRKANRTSEKDKSQKQVSELRFATGTDKPASLFSE